MKTKARERKSTLTQRQFPDSESLCQAIADASNGEALLAFSRGKDAIAAWLQMRKYFKHIVPLFRYCVPGGPLGFEERSLRYYEDFFETKIHRVPHPSLTRKVENLLFQAPQHCAIVENMDLPKRWDYEATNDYVRGVSGCDAYVANGTRAVDSPLRWRTMKVHGTCNHKKREFYAVFDWRLDRLVSEISTAGVRLPVDYHLWGRTFDGIDHRFLGPLKERFPEDYERVLKWFPLADLELFRHKMLQGVARA